MSDTLDFTGQFKPLPITNDRMALGRIGLACIFLSILIGLRTLLIVDEDGSSWIGVPMLLACLPFLWFSLTVPLSIRIADSLTVHYLLWRREYSPSEVSGIRLDSSGTQFGPGRLVPGMQVGIGSYNAATLETGCGKRI